MSDRYCLEILDNQGAEVPVPSNLAARVLSLSPRTIANGVHAGVVPRPESFGVLTQLARIPVLNSLQIDGNPVPVLRCGPLELDNSSDPRKWIGYGPGMTNDDLEAALIRWWTDPGRDLILHAGAFLAVRGGWIVAMVAVTGIRGYDADGRIEYEAELVGRCDNVLEEPEIVLTAHPLADIARKVLGNRVLGGQGGNFTRLAGDSR